MKLYGYNLSEKKKFTVDVENICDCINMDYGFSDDYFVYVNKEDRDLHFNDNIKIESEDQWLLIYLVSKWQSIIKNGNRIY